jgi:hypothetical protein
VAATAERVDQADDAQILDQGGVEHAIAQPEGNPDVEVADKGGVHEKTMSGSGCAVKSGVKSRAAAAASPVLSPRPAPVSGPRHTRTGPIHPKAVFTAAKAGSGTTFSIPARGYRWSGA